MSAHGEDHEVAAGVADREGTAAAAQWVRANVGHYVRPRPDGSYSTKDVEALADAALLVSGGSADYAELYRQALEEADELASRR